MKDEKYYLDKIKSLEEQIVALKNDLKLKCEQSDKILIQQSKMAAMGEMLDNIAHQWRQPLMELSAILISTEAKINLNGKISNEEILDSIHKSNLVMKYMSNTIDDFRDFFAKDKQKVDFKISDQIKRTAAIISTTLRNKNIKLNIIVKNNPVIHGFKNEYSQVLINLISNAKDILSQRSINDGIIEVKVFVEEENCITEVTDNAGGIKSDPLDKIFEPFYTSEKKDGTGIGLFMSKLIIEENMQGSITAKNYKNGAKFTITLPLS